MLKALFLTLLLWSGSNDLPGPVPEIAPLGPFGGDVRSLAVHPGAPDRFYLGTSDGLIYVSEDAGQSWRKLSPGLGFRDAVVDNLVFDPRDPDVLYAACWSLKGNRGWLLRTRDGGASWEKLSLGEFDSPIRAIAIAPSQPEVIAAGISEGVLLSQDGGASWDRITRGYRDLYHVESLAFDPHDSNTLYVGTWRLGWKTANLGKKWQPIHQGMYFDSDMFSLLVSPEDPNRLFASACTGVYRSDNGGGNWVKLRNGLPGDARRTRTLHFDPSNASVVYAGTTAGLFATRDGGGSWKKLTDEIVVNAVAVGPQNSSLVLVGADDVGVLRSLDGGATFLPSNSGFIHRQISALSTGGDGALYAGVANDGEHGGFFSSADGGASWTPFNLGLEKDGGAIVEILSASASGRVYLATRGAVYAGAPPDSPWSRLSGSADLQIAGMVFADSSEGSLLLATSEGLAALDLDSGKRRKVKLPVYDGKINAVFRDPGNGTLFAAGDIGVFRSSDGGDSWTIKVRGLPPIPVNFVKKAGEAWFAGTRQGLYVSRDGGESWSFCQGVYPLDIVALGANPLRPEQVFAAESAGGFLFGSEDAGESWRVIAPDNRSRVAQLVFNLTGELFAGTLSEGVYRLTLGEARATRLAGK